MLYPIAVLKSNDDKVAHAILFPDVENGATCCDELSDMHQMAHEFIDLHFEGLAEDGEPIPLPQDFNKHLANPEYDGCMWAWIDVDLSKYDMRTHKVNITLPQFLITKIDEKVNAHKSLYKSRSNYLAQLAMADLA